MKKFEEIIKESDLITYCWDECGGLINAEAFNSIDDYPKQRKAEIFYQTKEMIKVNLKFDKNYPITFYKKVGDSYVAFYKYQGKKWIKLL